MKRTIWPWVGLAVGAALVAHFGVVLAAPYVLMNASMKRIGQDGARENVWVHPPRTTEASRTVVRPSPDLAYSACVYDLSNGPVRVTAAPWGDYMSVSVFAANSDNIFVVNDRQVPRGVDLVLVKAGSDAPSDASRVVISPSTRGIVLQRRLAPTAESWARAAQARRGDICQSISAGADRST